MKLHRKDFFKALALGTISLPFAIRSCGGQQFAQHSTGPNIISDRKYRWKLVTTWPPNFPILGECCVLFAQWVKEMSGARLEVEVYGGGELVPPLESFGAVQSGVADIGHGCAYYWAGKAPAAQFFASVPFGMNAQQVNAWVMNGGGLALWKDLYGSFGLIPMLGGNSGVQMGGWFNKEINSIADLKGLKMRIPGLGGKVLKKAGGAPVLLAGGEIYTGLERGIIDATEWMGPFHDYHMGFYQIAKYYYSPGWHEPGTALEFFMNKKSYEKLPSDLQAIVQTAAARVNHWVLSELETQNSIYLQKLIKEENVQLRKFPREMLAQMKIFTNESLEEITQADAFSRKVYASYKAFKEAAADWSKWTEKAFYNDIQLS